MPDSGAGAHQHPQVPWVCQHPTTRRLRGNNSGSYGTRMDARNIFGSRQLDDPIVKPCDPGWQRLHSHAKPRIETEMVVVATS